MIRKDLIPALRSHYQPETTHKTTKHMSKVLKRKIIKVAIDDDIVYPTNGIILSIRLRFKNVFH